MTKKQSEQELEQMLITAREQVEIGGIYKHYKGNDYQVVDVAILTEEVGVGIIYRAQYGRGILFVRPLDVWLEEIEFEGGHVKRFAKV